MASTPYAIHYCRRPLPPRWEPCCSSWRRARFGATSSGRFEPFCQAKAGISGLARPFSRQIRPKTAPTKPFSGTRETIRKQRGRTSWAHRGGTVRPEAQMNHSIHSADRATHLQIVVIALMAGIAVAGFGISARTNTDYSQTAHVLKAGKPVVVTSSDLSKVQ